MPNPSPTRLRKACVIGSGPNGLTAAIVLAQAGLEVQVFEAEATIGGAARTMELTLPGFHHDFGSAVHPFAAGSPFFSSLPLQDYGLEWIHSLDTLAHPLDDGTAVTLPRHLAAAEATLGEDGRAWRRLMKPLARNWSALASDVLGPMLTLPRHPMLMARFGIDAVKPATTFARSHFRTDSVRALFAGLAAHSFLSLDEPLSSAFGILLGAAAHAPGWPIPRGGAQSITNALAGYLRHLGGQITTSTRIDRLSDLPAADLILCDITPRQLLAMVGAPELEDTKSLTQAYRRQLGQYRYGPAAFKVDYALSRPIPWNAPACLRSATVHLGGSLDQVAASEAAMAAGNVADSPFVLLAQPTLFDPTRAPEGKHIAWAYCHVPNGSTEDVLDRIESQIDRFASGFRSCILARHVSTPSTLEAGDANLVGGDISGGAMNLRQLLFRPTRREYRTTAPNLYLCSSATPPGGGVHGMCGFHAAATALREHAT
jgi:phytoene dehydrogenase-like protein